MITLQSSDGEIFEVDEVVAVESKTIKQMIEDGCTESTIPVPNVTCKILAKVIEYCKKHVETADIETAKAKDKGKDKGKDKVEEEHSDTAIKDEIKAWDADFIEVDRDTLYDLLMASNFLDIKSLFDLTCQKVADMMKGKQPEEIRKIFDIENDFTPEEEDEIRAEYKWAFK